MSWREAEAAGEALAREVAQRRAESDAWRAEAAAAEQRAAAAEGRPVEVCPRACYALPEDRS